jgi:beta-glucosidase
MEVLEQNSPRSLNGVVLNFSPCYPATANAADAAAADAADVALNQWYLQPMLDGRYPELLDHLPLDERPNVLAGDMDVISHQLGFLGVNYYTRGVYRAGEARTFVQLPPAGPLTDMGWEDFPQGLTDLLVALDTRYDLPPIFIAENGVALPDAVALGEVNDPRRIAFIQSHVAAVDRAIGRGVNVAGYFYWSLMDNFEWAEGYSKRFGLVHVDFTTQRRIVKASGRAYRDFLNCRARGHEPAADRPPVERPTVGLL